MEKIYQTLGRGTSASTASASTPSSTSTWSSGPSGPRPSTRYAAKQGRDDFFMFGEVYSRRPGDHLAVRHRRAGSTPRSTSPSRTRPARTPPRAAARRSWPRVFGDDYTYTTDKANAYEQVTFLGNHDMGRIGTFLKQDNPKADRRRAAAEGPARQRADVPQPRQPGRLLRRRAGLHRRGRRQGRPPDHVRLAGPPTTSTTT